ncbi:cytochrome P450 [Aspergillus aurantiobrunneus]
MSIVGAATETTKIASVVTAFHIIHNADILRKLQDELDEAIPSPPPLRLPYLAAPPPRIRMVSMDSYHMHHDESVFPDSFTFRPSRYPTSFGRGTRMCVGMGLADAEITMVLAHLFRAYELELFATGRCDVDRYRDLLFLGGGGGAVPGSRE